MVALHHERWDAQPADTSRIIDVVEVLAAQLPAWQVKGACRTEDPALFFVDRGQPTAPARAVCARCPVIDECREYAIDNWIDHGIFGGLAPSERRKLARERSRPRTPKSRVERPLPVQNAKTRQPM